MAEFFPREIVSELDRYIVGQTDAKRAVAIALRNRWRRGKLEGAMREEVAPKNILMIGPTGCGKTEIARRLARLAQAPFLKVEATKFTEVGYVGRDVEQIIRDLVEVAVSMGKDKQRERVRARAQTAAQERIVSALVGQNASPATRDSFRRMLLAGELEDREIEIDLAPSGPSSPFLELPAMGAGSVGAFNFSDLLGKAMGKPKRKRLKVSEAREPLILEESETLLDHDGIVQDAIRDAENQGIVFIDEIDKICVREGRGGGGGEISREGVQRDLLPLIEGTTVATKHGAVRTEHILFIASGAFHLSKPSDLLPELQGRLPIRVELTLLTEADFLRILTETEVALPKQYRALLETEGVMLEFSDSGLSAIAAAAARINASVENIGARRLQTVMERVLEDISFDAPDLEGQTIVIDAAYVEACVGPLSRNTDLSRYVL